MLVRTLLLYASKKARSGLQDCSQLLITKKTPVYDFVAIDATGYVATVLSNTKNLVTQTEQRRQREVGKNVVSTLQELLRRITCKQSLLIALDGAESLAKVLNFRNGASNRKVENRLQRLPGSALMQAVDDKIAKMMPERNIVPSEVVLAGVCVSGCVEEKISAWANDLACKSNFNGNTTSLCIIGSSETVLSAIGLTPYYDICSVVQNGSELRQTKLVDVLDWFRLNEYAKAGKSKLVAHARTDLLFLYMLCYGCAASELISYPKLNFEQLLDVYHKEILMQIENAETGNNNNNKASKDGENANIDEVANGGSDDNLPKVKPKFLFSEEANNTLQLNLHMFAKVLTATININVPPKHNILIESYLRYLLQSHTMLCLGYTKDVYYLPEYMTTTSSATLVSESSGGKKGEDALREFSTFHLLACVYDMIAQNINISDKNTLKTKGESITDVIKNNIEEVNSDSVDKGDSRAVSTAESNAEQEKEQEKLENSSVNRYYPFFKPTQPLTAGEYTILCQSKVANVVDYVQSYVNLALREEVAQEICKADITTAHQLVRNVLSYANPEHPHRALCLAPSYCWLQNERNKSWRMQYVDVGVCGCAKEIRRTRNAVAGVSMSISVSTDGPCVFESSTLAWEPIMHFPFSPLRESDRAEMEKTAKEQKEHQHHQQHQHQKVVEKNTILQRKTLKVLTWNVLFDRFSNQPTPLGKPGVDWCSTKRYPVLSKLIAREEADVIGMQEVEPVFLSYLASQDWCRKNYMLSCAPSSPILNPWGVSMLIHTRRWPIVQLRHVNVPAWDGHVSLMPLVTLRTLRGPLHVAVAHLLAPYTKNHENVRTNQDNMLRNRITKGLSGDCIAMGDFNDWPTNEFVMPEETEYRECWPLLHPKDPGKTMDETNTFCNLKIEEIFFGRSDKVFLRSKHIKPVEAHLIGTKSVNDENGNKDAPSYLFPSDHYGVSMTFEL